LPIRTTGAVHAVDRAFLTLFLAGQDEAGRERYSTARAFTGATGLERPIAAGGRRGAAETVSSCLGRARSSPGAHASSWRAGSSSSLPERGLSPARRPGLAAGQEALCRSARSTSVDPTSGSPGDRGRRGGHFRAFRETCHPNGRTRGRKSAMRRTWIPALDLSGALAAGAAWGKSTAGVADQVALGRKELAREHRLRPDAATRSSSHVSTR